VSNLAPYSTTILGASPLSFRLRMAALRRLTDRSIARADRVFLLSAQALDLIVEPSLPSKAEIIPMAPPSVPADLSAKRPNIRQPYFLVVSDLLRFKGIEQVVRALALLAPRSRPLVLVCGRFIDRQYARQLQEESRARGLQESFRLVGPVDHDRLLSLMAGCRGCVVPSRFENSSRIPAEAMATGAPVIASDIVPLREACADAALYFPLDDVDTLRAHLERLVGDDLFRLDLTRKGAARIRGMSSTDASARILTSLEHLLDL